MEAFRLGALGLALVVAGCKSTGSARLASDQVPQAGVVDPAAGVGAGAAPTTVVELPPAGANPATLDLCDLVTQTVRSAGGNVQVKLAAGLYTCRAPLILDQSNSWVTGVGEVWLKAENGVRMPLVILGSVKRPNGHGVLDDIIHNVAIENLKIDGNRYLAADQPLPEPPPQAASADVKVAFKKVAFNALHTYECWGADKVIAAGRKAADGTFQTCDNGDVDTTYIRNNGVTIRGVHGGTVRNVSEFRALSGGLVTEKDCASLLVEDFTAQDNLFDGFAGYLTTGSLFRRLSLSDNTFSAVSIDLNFSGNQFEDSRFFENFDNGIYARHSKGNGFRRVEITGNHNFAVYFEHAELARQRKCEVLDLKARGLPYTPTQADLDMKIAGLDPGDCSRFDPDMCSHDYTFEDFTINGNWSAPFRVHGKNCGTSVIKGVNAIYTNRGRDELFLSDEGSTWTVDPAMHLDYRKL